MNDILFPLTAAVSLAVAALLVMYCIRFLRKPPEKIMSVVSVCIVFVLSVMLALAFNGIPERADSLIWKCMEQVRNRLEEEYPGCMTGELDDRTLNDLIEDCRQFTGSMDTYIDGAGFLARIIGVKTFISAIDGLADGMERNVNAFNAEGKALTAENILLYVRDQASFKVHDMCRTALWAVLVAALVLYMVIFLLCIAFRKGWISASGSSVVFGDDVKK